MDFQSRRRGGNALQATARIFPLLQAPGPVTVLQHPLRLTPSQTTAGARSLWIFLDGRLLLFVGATGRRRRSISTPATVQQRSRQLLRAGLQLASAMPDESVIEMIFRRP